MFMLVYKLQRAVSWVLTRRRSGAAAAAGRDRDDLVYRVVLFTRNIEVVRRPASVSPGLNHYAEYSRSNTPSQNGHIQHYFTPGDLHFANSRVLGSCNSIF